MTLLVAASVAALVLVATVGLSRRGADRRRQALLVDLADEVGKASRQLARALDRVAGTRERDLRAVAPPLTVTRVLETALSLAVDRSGADAVAIRVESPPSAAVSAVRGEGADVALLESTLAATGPDAFRAATVRWSYQSPGGVAGPFRSALVVPIVEGEEATGALVAFAASDIAFGPAQERALRSVADDAASQLATARRYEELDRRHLTDALTGLRNSTAYEIDLERAVARARERGTPLSIVLVELGGHGRSDRGTTEVPGPVLADVARALSGVSRSDDTVYRRGDLELAVLLRRTDSTGAAVVAERMREEACSVLDDSDGGTVAVAAVHWRASESADSLDERASAALESTLRASVESKGATSSG